MKKLFLGIIIIGIGVSTSICIEKYNYADYISKIKSQEYFGIVDSVYLDPNSKMQPKAIINKVTKVSLQSDIYTQVLPGDILYKQAGNFKFYRIHNMDTTIYYQEYNGEEIKNPG